MRKSLCALYSIALCFGATSTYAQSQSDIDVAEAVSRDWKKGIIEKRNSQFQISVGTTGGNLVAYNINTPSGDWINKKTYINCDNFIGDDERFLNSGTFDDGHFYDLSGPFRFLYLDDTASMEEKRAPRFMISAQTCQVKKKPSSTINYDAREKVLRNNINVLRVGPTFTCSDIRTCDPLAQIVLTQKYRNNTIAELDVALVQPYQALRSIATTDINALRSEAGKFSQFVKDFCRLPKRYTREDPHGNLIIPAQDANCVAEEYRKQRQRWIARVVELNDRDALEEVSRSVEDHWFAQFLMQFHGFLPKDIRVDGSYGAGTRNAIKAAQTEAKIPTSGFLSQSTFDFLIMRNPYGVPNIQAAQNNTPDKLAANTTPTMTANNDASNSSKIAEKEARIQALLEKFMGLYRKNIKATVKYSQHEFLRPCSIRFNNIGVDGSIAMINTIRLSDLTVVVGESKNYSEKWLRDIASQSPYYVEFMGRTGPNWETNLLPILSPSLSNALKTFGTRSDAEEFSAIVKEVDSLCRS